MKLTHTLIAAALVGTSAVASAASVTLDFEDAERNSQVLNLYSAKGITFSGTELVQWGTDYAPNTNPPSGKSLLEMYGDDETKVGELVGLTLNVSAGFSSKFSLWYATTQLTNGKGSIRIFDDLNATGTSLGEITLDPNGQGGGFANWSQSQVSFSGTAKSILISGYASQYLLDDFYFGDVGGGTEPPPGTLPEPSSYALAGLALLGLAAGTRRARNKR